MFYRMKRGIKTAVLLTAVLTASLFAAGASYAPEDLKGHWAEGAAYTLMQQKAMTARNDGKFHPDALLSRQEAVQAMTALGAGSAANGGGASSLTRGEFAQWIERWLVQRDGPAGEDVPPPPGEQDPAGPLDRETIWAALPQELQAQLTPELWALFSEAEWQNWADQYIIQPQNQNSAFTTASFSDIAGHPAEAAVRALQQRNVVYGTPGGSFRPDALITRGEAAAMLFRALGCPMRMPVYAPEVAAPAVTTPVEPERKPTVEAPTEPEPAGEAPKEPELPDYRVIDVPYISQLTPVSAPVGCEAVSLLMGLRGMGYALDVDIYTYLANMPTTASNPAKGFVGSPFHPDLTKKTRTTIYPPKLAEYGSLYGPVRDISGSSVEELQNEVLSGHPVVAYVTLWWAKPYYRNYNIEGETQRLLSNNHAVLVCGFNRATGAYYIADPYNKKDLAHDLYYWVDGATFDPLYLERCHALAVG